MLKVRIYFFGDNLCFHFTNLLLTTITNPKAHVATVEALATEMVFLDGTCIIYFFIALLLGKINSFVAKFAAIPACTLKLF